MSKPRFVTIKFLPWESEYDFGQNSKNTKYFYRMPFDFLDDPRVQALEHHEFVLIAHILKQLSRNNGATLTLLWSNIRTILKHNRHNIEATLEQLSALQLIEIVEIQKTNKIRKDKIKKDKITKTRKKTVKKKVESEDRPDSAKAGAYFKQKYHEHFGRPYLPWGVKQNSVMKRWLASVGRERAKVFIDAYFQWPDKWVTQRGHTIELLESKTPELNAWIENPLEHVKDLAFSEAAASAKKSEIKNEKGNYDEARIRESITQQHKANTDLEHGGFLGEQVENEAAGKLPGATSYELEDTR